MTLRVTLIQGGGSGLDQVPAVRDVVAAAGVDVEWDERSAGWASLERGGAPLPDALLRSVRQTRLALKTRLLPPPGKAGMTASAGRRWMRRHYRSRMPPSTWCAASSA